MIELEYWNGIQWKSTGQKFGNERFAWLSLGGDDYNYRTVNYDTGKVLTDKSGTNISS